MYFLFKKILTHKSILITNLKIGKVAITSRYLDPLTLTAKKDIP